MSEEINTSHCRFYENKYPEIDDVVIVNIKEVSTRRCQTLSRHYCLIAVETVLTHCNFNRLLTWVPMVSTSKVFSFFSLLRFSLTFWYGQCRDQITNTHFLQSSFLSTTTLRVWFCSPSCPEEESDLFRSMSRLARTKSLLSWESTQIRVSFIGIIDMM